MCETSITVKTEDAEEQQEAWMSFCSSPPFWLHAARQQPAVVLEQTLKLLPQKKGGRLQQPPGVSPVQVPVVLRDTVWDLHMLSGDEMRKSLEGVDELELPAEL